MIRTPNCISQIFDQVFRTVAQLSLFLFCTIGTAAPSFAEDWPQWRGPRSNGSWNGPEIKTTWPESGLKQVWKQPIGGGYAGVVVAGERVVLFDYVKQPTEQERVQCFHSKTGDLIWTRAYNVEYGKLDYGSGPRAAPTIHNNRVYVLGAIGHLHCLDLRDGSVVWQSHLIDNFHGRLSIWGYAASPTLVNDLLIVQPGGGNGFSIVALNSDNGESVWHSASDEAGYAPPIVVNSGSVTQLICWTPSHIRSLSLATGKEFWSVPYKVTYGVSIATPIFHRNIVLVSGYWEGTKAIRLGDEPTVAELIWEEGRQLRGLMSQPLYRDGLVYLLDKGHGLTCFEIETGKVLWDDGNKMTPRGRNPQASMIWLNESDRKNGDKSLILNSNGELILARLNRTGYQELARTPIIGETWAHPAYAGQFVFARSDSELVCVKLPLAD